MTDARQTTAERRDSGPARSPDAAPGLMQVWLLGRFEVRVGSLTIGEDGWRLRKAASQRQHEHLGVRPALRPRHRSGERRGGELPGGDLADPEPALRLRRDAFVRDGQGHHLEALFHR
jgi:hypothetical protein